MALKSRNTVLGILLNKDGRILIGFSERLNLGDSGFDSHSWKFPQGGIEQSETALMALVRELKEELNFIVKKRNVIGRLSKPVSYYFHDEGGFPDFEVVLHPYLVKYLGESFDYDGFEFSRLKWIIPDDIFDLELSVRKDAYIVILKRFNLIQ